MCHLISHNMFAFTIILFWVQWHRRQPTADHASILSTHHDDLIVSEHDQPFISMIGEYRSIINRSSQWLESIGAWSVVHHDDWRVSEHDHSFITMIGEYRSMISRSSRWLEGIRAWLDVHHDDWRVSEHDQSFRLHHGDWAVTEHDKPWVADHGRQKADIKHDIDFPT